MSITEKDLNHVMTLAHLEIDPEKKPQILSQLQNILDHMDALNKINLEHILPMANTNLQPTLMRKDEIKKQFDVQLEPLAPHWESPYFVVPKILEE